jgi:hypothetical protein
MASVPLRAKLFEAASEMSSDEGAGSLAAWIVVRPALGRREAEAETRRTAVARERPSATLMLMLGAKRSLARQH